MAVAKKSCSNCIHAVKAEVKIETLTDDAIECRESSPQVIAMLTPQGSAIASQWPRVSRNAHCSKWKGSDF